MAARIVADQPGQGWSLLCNGVIVLDDCGKLLPDGHAVSLSPCSVRRCRSQVGLGLRFVALDFLIRDGSPVFLEVNPDGDWPWADRKSATS